MANNPPTLNVNIPAPGASRPPKATKTAVPLAQALVPGSGEWLVSLGVTPSYKAYFQGDRSKLPKRGRGYDHIPPAPPMTEQAQSVDQMQKIFLGLPPAQQAQIQSLLYRAGFYGSGSGFVPLFGHVKREDYAAFSEALAMAVNQHVDIGHYIQSAADAADKSGLRDPSKIHAPKVIDLTDPAALNASLHDAFKSALGRDPTEKEKTAFVTSFHARQAAYGEQVASVSQQTTDAQNAAMGYGPRGPVTPESQGLMYVTGQGYVPNPNYVPPANQGPAPQTTVTMTKPDETGSARSAAVEQHPNEAKAFALGQNGQQILAALTQASPEPGR